MPSISENIVGYFQNIHNYRGEYFLDIPKISTVAWAAKNVFLIFFTNPEFAPLTVFLEIDVVLSKPYITIPSW